MTPPFLSRYSTLLHKHHQMMWRVDEINRENFSILSDLILHEICSMDCPEVEKRLDSLTLELTELERKLSDNTQELRVILS